MDQRLGEETVEDPAGADAERQPATTALRPLWAAATAEDFAQADREAREIEARIGPDKPVGEEIWRASHERGDVIGALLRLECGVLLMDVGNAKQAAEWGHPLVPTHVVDDEPVTVDSVPDAVRSFAEMRSTTNHPGVAGRWNDLRWLRWKDFPAVVPAIENYLAFAASMNTSSFHELKPALDALRRAADLSLRVGQQRPVTCAAIREGLRTLARSRYAGMVQQLAEETVSLLSTEPAEAAALAHELFDAANTATADHGARMIFEAVENLARVGRDNDLFELAKRARAESHEREANAASGLVRLVKLRQAVAIYQEIGPKQAIDRVRRAYEDASREAIGDLKPVESVITINRGETKERIAKYTLGQGPSAHGMLRLPFEIGYFERWKFVRRDREQSDAENILTSLATHVMVEADGRIQPDPDQEANPEQFARARDTAYYSRNIALAAGIFETADLTELRELGAWSSPYVLTTFSLADEDLGEACSSGVMAFEAREHWAAAHMLVPQLERALRALGRLVGAEQMKFAPNQGTRWASFETVLTDEGIKRAMGEHRTGALIALYSDEHGQNWRNNMAHGALSTDTAAASISTVTVLALLMMCMFILRAKAGITAADHDRPRAE